MTYKLFGKHGAGAPAGLEGQDINRILRKSDGACIPKNPENTDYQEYLEWLSEGNTPEAAD
jgi:hypothetical protein